MVLDKIRTDGLLSTLDAVRNKLDQPLPMGYCNVGMLGELGAGVSGFAVGDRVASNGKHTEVVSVPVNLCAKVPAAAAARARSAARDDHPADPLGRPHCRPRAMVCGAFKRAGQQSFAKLLPPCHRRDQPLRRSAALHAVFR